MTDRSRFIRDPATAAPVNPHEPHSYETDTGAEGRCTVCGGPGDAVLHTMRYTARQMLTKNALGELDTMQQLPDSAQARATAALAFAVLAFTEAVVEIAKDFRPFRPSGPMTR